MSLNSGLGNVNTTKNHSLLSPSCEKITAIRHQNQSDYWIVTKLYNSNAFHSYLLSATGINTIPEKSFNGTIVTVPTHTLGYLKSSPDGKKIACSNYRLGEVELFDFNNQTGRMSNPIKLTNFNSIDVYGVEFSPNSSLIYIAEVIATGTISQFDLTAGSATDINNSRYTVNTNVNYFGALQLAPNNKIYVTIENKVHLSVIENPNLVGVAC